MLRLLRIDAFKAYAGQSIPLEPTNVLVGVNGSGKTSVLQAVEFLHGLVAHDLRTQLASHRWTYRDLPHLASPNQAFSFGALLELDGRHLWWSVRLGKRKHENIAAERVLLLDEDETRAALAGQVPQETATNSLLIRDGREMSRRVGHDRWESINQTLTSSWLSTVTDEDRSRFPEVVAVADWARRVQPYVVLDPNRLREPSSLHRDGIGVAGEHLAGFLRHLRSSHPDAFERVLRRATDAYPRLSELRIRQEGSAYSLAVREAWGDEDVGPLLNARQASDGLLRLFALAALPESTPTPTLVMVDEIENGVHPQLLGALMTMLEQLSEDEGIQVLTTSHSPLIVDYVAQPESVLLTVRSGDGSARVERLSDTPGYEALAGTFSKGEMWLARGERGLIEPAVRDA
ncbi:ATP-binding protein [Patulibacter sp. NPDC049589]|uniref:AAA family ATPase n=1 Tax=Patulibacter sp. NPDC049589 TaxID=3154731 RepID=UPI003430460F